jgi:hypothetical protein
VLYSDIFLAQDGVGTDNRELHQELIQVVKLCVGRSSDVFGIGPLSIGVVRTALSRYSLDAVRRYGNATTKLPWSSASASLVSRIPIYRSSASRDLSKFILHGTCYCGNHSIAQATMCMYILAIHNEIHAVMKTCQAGRSSTRSSRSRSGFFHIRLDHSVPEQSPFRLTSVSVLYNDGSLEGS